MDMKKSVFFPLLLAPLPLHLAAQEAQRPHVVLIMCDDMGFSDLGCYGGEVRTPHLDSLAMAGVRFSQFKNTGRSCPSRAALLTGHWQHEVGMGWMTAVDEHRPGYRGQIAGGVPTIAERMRGAGYRTYMSGKWHVTVEGAFDAPNGSYPTERGFDRYYGSLSGGGSYYAPRPLYSGVQRVDSVPDDYYYTTALTDSAIAFINAHPADEPMFLYVAHFAPHLPLQAPRDRVGRCIDRYRAGYDVLRRQRFERQQRLGIVPPGMELPTHQREWGGDRPAWDDLTGEQQRQWTEDMATYAAMIEIMDDEVGRLIDALRRKGMLDDTVLMFLSDNGATNEGGRLGQLMADLSNTPYRSYKQWCFQGGTSTPFIVAWGDGRRNTMRGQICRQPAHLVDIVPTCLDLAGVEWGGEGLPGMSLLPAIGGGGVEERTLFFEHQGSCALISGQWKLVRPDRHSPWELIDLDTDPFETRDLSQEYPANAAELERMWNEWAHRCNVLPLEDKPWTERINYYKGLYPDQDGRE